MEKIILLSTLMLASISRADIIQCLFTELFIKSIYSTGQSTLTYEEDANGNINKKNVIKNVSLQIKSAGQFELVSKEGKVLQTLTLNNKGSDGMSDTIYPYDALDNFHNKFGGCESNYLKVQKRY